MLHCVTKTYIFVISLPSRIFHRKVPFKDFCYKSTSSYTLFLKSKVSEKWWNYRLLTKKKPQVKKDIKHILSNKTALEVFSSVCKKMKRGDVIHFTFQQDLNSLKNKVMHVAIFWATREPHLCSYLCHYTSVACYTASCQFLHCAASTIVGRYY